MEGHQALVDKLSSFDYLAEAKKRGIVVPPHFSNPTWVDFAKAIGYVKAGFSIENHWRLHAKQLEMRSARIDRQLALLNGGDLNPTIRRIQDDGDVDGDGVPVSIDGTDDREPIHMEGDCYQNANGSFTCNLVATSPNYANCDYEAAFALLLALGYGLICLVEPIFCAIGLFAEAAWGGMMIYDGCI